MCFLVIVLTILAIDASILPHTECSFLVMSSFMSPHSLLLLLLLLLLLSPPHLSTISLTLPLPHSSTFTIFAHILAPTTTTASAFLPDTTSPHHSLNTHSMVTVAKQVFKSLRPWPLLTILFLLLLIIWPVFLLLLPLINMLLNLRSGRTLCRVSLMLFKRLMLGFWFLHILNQIWSV